MHCLLLMSMHVLILRWSAFRIHLSCGSVPAEWVSRCAQKQCTQPLALTTRRMKSHSSSLVRTSFVTIVAAIDLTPELINKLECLNRHGGRGASPYNPSLAPVHTPQREYYENNLPRITQAILAVITATRCVITPQKSPGFILCYRQGNPDCYWLGCCCK